MQSTFLYRTTVIEPMREVRHHTSATIRNIPTS